MTAAMPPALAPLVAAFGEPHSFGRHAWSWVATSDRPRVGLAIIGRGTGRNELKAWVGPRVVRVEDDGGEPPEADYANVLRLAGAYSLPGVGAP